MTDQEMREALMNSANTLYPPTGATWNTGGLITGAGISSVMRGQRARPQPPLPPEIQARLDELAVERKCLEEIARNQIDQIAQQEAMLRHGVGIGTKLRGADGEEATVVWVKSGMGDLGLALNVTKTTMIHANELGNYWGVDDEKIDSPADGV
jgi:hypothetical protein